MGLSNLPPGCSSPDGGIDHEFEEAAEELLNLCQDARDVKILCAIAPAILDAIKDEYRKGFEDGRNELHHERQARRFNKLRGCDT